MFSCREQIGRGFAVGCGSSGIGPTNWLRIGPVMAFFWPRPGAVEIQADRSALGSYFFRACCTSLSATSFTWHWRLCAHGCGCGLIVLFHYESLLAFFSYAAQAGFQ